jgi:2-oxo-4-hydroxy-4-carboxy-5-ureidoimidazoline decarboxylase
VLPGGCAAARRRSATASVITVSTASADSIGIAEFDDADAADAAAELVPCCASRKWVARVVHGRPYRTLDRLAAGSDAALAGLDWPDLVEALAAHPRIGERRSGGEREAGWSRQEQSATATMADATRQALVEANVAYERAFGHVFLICATGLSTEQLLTALQTRLHNDPVAERSVVRGELTKIVRLRLARAFH